MFSNNDDYLNNTFNNNGAGVAVMYSHKVKMEGNKFEMNWGPASYGILLKDITDSYIHNNIFYKNSVGIHMEGSSRINAFKNIFKENGWAMKVQASCNDNNFHHNNYYGNSFDELDGRVSATLGRYRYFGLRLANSKATSLHVAEGDSVSLSYSLVAEYHRDLTIPIQKST